VFGLKVKPLSEKYLYGLNRADKKIKYRISNKEYRISKYEKARVVQALAQHVALS
jgi:hypothetical protein